MGDDEQRVKANRAVRSLQKLLGRGGRKVRRLNREKLKQCAKKKALEQNEEKKSRKLELELKRMRSARKGSDHALVKEGMADEAYIRGYRRYRGIRDDYGPVPMAGEIGVPVMPGGMDVCGQVKLAGNQSGRYCGFRRIHLLMNAGIRMRLCHMGQQEETEGD